MLCNAVESINPPIRRMRWKKFVRYRRNQVLREQMTSHRAFSKVPPLSDFSCPSSERFSLIITGKQTRLQAGAGSTTTRTHSPAYEVDELPLSRVPHQENSTHAKFGQLKVGAYKRYNFLGGGVTGIHCTQNLLKKEPSLSGTSCSPNDRENAMN